MKKKDRLSALPDFVLQQILSFLDMRIVVQTCILSKRWRLAWVSLPTLNFYFNECDSDYSSSSDDERSDWHDECSDWRFVDKVLIHRDGSNIQKFKFSGDDIYASIEDGLYTAIVAAVRHNLQELDISWSMDTSMRLPHCLFTCQSLTSLKLTGVSLMTLPNSIHLPRLKILHLESLYINYKIPFKKFVRSCPVLESLILLNNFQADEMKGANLITSIQTLKHLRVECYGHCYTLDLTVPNLKPLFLKEGPSNNFSPFLEIVDMETADFYDDFRHRHAYSYSIVRMLLQAVSNVKALSLSGPCIKMILETLPGQKRVATQFASLKHMKLKTDFSHEGIPEILVLLEVSPYLETFIIEKKPESVPDKQNVWNIEDPLNSLGCLVLHHLKVVEIRGFQGCMFEQIILKNVLKASVTLERLVLKSEGNVQNEEKKWERFCDNLLKFPRASANVAILFLQKRNDGLVP